MARNEPTPDDRPRCGPGRGRPLAGPGCGGTAHSHRVRQSGTVPAASPPATPKPALPPSIDDLAWARRSATYHPRLEGTGTWSRATGAARQGLAALARARSLDRRQPRPGSRQRARPCHRQPLGWPVVEDPLASSHHRSAGPRGRYTAKSQPDPKCRPAATRAGTQRSWRRPMFPRGYPLSIFGAGELNCRVRDGNGCGLSARVTRILACDDAIGRRGVRYPHAWPGRTCRVSVHFDLQGFAWASRLAPLPETVHSPMGGLLKRSSPRPLVRLSCTGYPASTCRLSSRCSPCGLTRLTRWGTSS
jgi:hypothetical protein